MTTNPLSLSLGSGDPFDVRKFTVSEAMSRPFEVRLLAVCPSSDVDFEAAIGAPARFSIDDDVRVWTGVCAEIGLTRVEPSGLSTYAVHLAPRLWLLGHRRNYRVFQDKSELDVVLEVLAGWGIEPDLRLDAGSYGKRRQRTQYAETDLAFVSRLLEDIGVSYFFDMAGGESKLVLADAPNRGSSRGSIRFVDAPTSHLPHEYVTAVRTQREVQPGRVTQSDVDYRRPQYPLAASSAGGAGVEARLERYLHEYGSFLWKGGGGDTPVADDRGAARTDQGQGGTQVERMLDAHRSAARGAGFRTTAHDLGPGKILTIDDHPRSELGAPLLVVASLFEGEAVGEWTHACAARYTDVDYRPARVTPRPRTQGVESATVTGPSGEEIHTDEFGRVRVKFHWDREGAADETSSCWVPVSQVWAGSGFGAISLPRVGQEVLVDFLGEDPDRPVVTGRVFTATMPPPYQLPRYKMVSGFRSESYPRPKSGPSARMGGGPPIGGGESADTLGGGHEAPAPANDGPQPFDTPVQTEPSPGVFGATQARPDQLEALAKDAETRGIDDGDVKRSANAVTFQDEAGKQQVYIQAQKDLVMTVKHDLTGAVGHDRAFLVHGNDYEEVAAGYQSTSVKLDRSMEVKAGKQTHTVEDDIVELGQENRYIRTKDDYYQETVEGGQTIASQKAMLCAVGDSAIMIGPKTVIVQSPMVYINPGQAFVDAAVSGKNLASLREAAQAEARIQKATTAMIENRHTWMPWRNRDQLSPGMLRDKDSYFAQVARNAGVTDQREIEAAGQRALPEIDR